MTKFTVHRYKDVEWEDPIAIVGFPSLGLAGSIAANFLSRSLELEVVGGIGSPEFPPYAVVQNGVPLPPIRMYGRERRCDDTGVGCDGLIVVTSEFMLKLEQHYPLAVTLLDWFAENGVKKVICLEGIVMFDSEMGVYGIGSTPAANDIMEKYSIERMSDNIVRGTSGVMLYEGRMRNMDVIAILGPARSDIPDPRGAAKLMEPLARMLPELRIDTDPLYKEAEEIEKRIEAHSAATGDGGKDVLYG